MPQARNVIFLVADSLRYDSVHAGPIGMPYTESRAIQYSQARSGGCWTLPATASLFTGLMPHQHGATAQSRAIRDGVPTMAEHMRAQGYRTYQITANVATTHIFGLHRGFDEVRPIWTTVPARFRKIHQLMLLAGKPRLRKRLFSKEYINGQLSEDLDASKVWLQSTAQDVFAQARQLLAENEARGEKTFLFLNLMETHFPYHLGPGFKTISEGVIDRVREVIGLFHLVNQTWLTTGKQHIEERTLDILRQRQRRAWEWLAPQVDEFVRELHDETGNMVVFGSDHGDNFGEQGWLYHFSNVTDAGNRVPLFVLPHDGRDARVVNTPVSARDVSGAILTAAGSPAGNPILLEEPESSLPVMQSYWYNNQGKTLNQFKFNQIAFLAEDNRYLYRQGQWFTAPPQTDGREPVFALVPEGLNPVEEAVRDATRKAAIRQVMRDWTEFSGTIRT